MSHTAEEAKLATVCQLSLGRLGKRSQTSYVNILRTVEARPEVHRVERVVCFHKIGSKVFMDARDTVNVEEWGSLPPGTASFYPHSSKVEHSTDNRATEDRYLDRVPVFGGSRGLRRGLASFVTRRVRYPRPPPVLG